MSRVKKSYKPKKRDWRLIASIVFSRTFVHFFDCGYIGDFIIRVIKLEGLLVILFAAVIKILLSVGYLWWNFREFLK